MVDIGHFDMRTGCIQNASAPYKSFGCRMWVIVHGRQDKIQAKLDSLQCMARGLDGTHFPVFLRYLETSVSILGVLVVTEVIDDFGWNRLIVFTGKKRPDFIYQSDQVVRRFHFRKRKGYLLPNMLFLISCHIKKKVYFNSL